MTKKVHRHFTILFSVGNLEKAFRQETDDVFSEVKQLDFGDVEPLGFDVENPDFGDLEEGLPQDQDEDVEVKEEKEQEIVNEGQDENVEAKEEQEQEIVNEEDENMEAEEKKAPSANKRFLKDMDEETRKAELERRNERRRENSRKWHANWIRKGVPREAAEKKDPENHDDDQPGDGEDQQNEAQQDPGEQDQGQQDGVQQQQDERPEGADEKPGFVEGFLPGQDILKGAVDGDLRKTRMFFINASVAWRIQAGVARSKSTMDEGNKAWMASNLRAMMKAGRASELY